MFKPNQNKTTTKREKRDKLRRYQKKKRKKERKKSPPEEGQNRKHDLIKHGNINQNDIVYQMRVRKGNTT